MNIHLDVISSASNPLIKTLRGLERKKIRNETGLFLAEGVRLITQALQQGWSIDTLAVSDSGRQREKTEALLALAAEQGARLVQIPDRLAGAITRKNNPQAVLAAIKQRPLHLESLDPRSGGLWLGLYEIRDPGNLGTILRTADCAALAGIVMIGTCCDPYSVEAVRASMGSLFDVGVASASYSDFQTWRRTGGLNMVAASLHGTHRHTEIDFRGPSVILMGNEQAGLPPAVEADCDQLCRIPMRGGADSLNLAQASAVMVYEGWRQREFQ